MAHVAETLTSGNERAAGSLSALQVILRAWARTSRRDVERLASELEDEARADDRASEEPSDIQSPKSLLALLDTLEPIEEEFPPIPELHLDPVDL